MISNLVSTAFIVGLVVMIFWTPAVFSKGILMMDNEKLSGRDRVLTKIPVVNVVMAEHIYTGCVSKVGISIAVTVVMLCIRLLCVFLLPSVYILQIATVILFLLSLAGFMLSNTFLIWTILTDTDVTSLMTKVGLSIVFPLGQYYIGNFLPTVIKNMGKEEATFK